jgi:hypothetical protein
MAQETNPVTTFAIIDGNTFGYTTADISAPFFRVTVMGVDVTRGGDPLLLNKTVMATPARARLATADDFCAYRVSIDGYRNNPMYAFLDKE